MTVTGNLFLRLFFGSNLTGFEVASIFLQYCANGGMAPSPFGAECRPPGNISLHVPSLIWGPRYDSYGREPNDLV